MFVDLIDVKLEIWKITRKNGDISSNISIFHSLANNINYLLKLKFLK